MRKAIIHKMSSGHWVATFNTNGVVIGTRVVGATTSTAAIAAKHVQDNFPVDKVGIKADDGTTDWLPSR
jgi:hypothetical protein